MKWITYTLLATAALLLVVPALSIGSYLFALSTIVVTAAGILVLRQFPHSKSADIVLIALSILSAFALFIGIHPVFPAISLMLSVYAWNAGHRFGHLERAQAEQESKRQFVIQILTLSFIPSVVMSLFLTAFLYIRFSMSFGLGLGLSLAALLSIVVFVRFAHAAREREK